MQIKIVKTFKITHHIHIENTATDLHYKQSFYRFQRNKKARPLQSRLKDILFFLIYFNRYLSK